MKIWQPQDKHKDPRDYSPLFLPCELSMCLVLPVCLSKVLVPFVSRVFGMVAEKCCVRGPLSAVSQTCRGILWWNSSSFIVGQETSGADWREKRKKYISKTCLLSEYLCYVEISAIRNESRAIRKLFTPPSFIILYGIDSFLWWLNQTKQKFCAVAFMPSVWPINWRRHLYGLSADQKCPLQLLGLLPRWWCLLRVHTRVGNSCGKRQL